MGFEYVLAVEGEILYFENSLKSKSATNIYT